MLVVVLAIISAVVYSFKRRKNRKSQVVDAWIKALEEKQAEAKAKGSPPAVIEGVTMVPPEATEQKQQRQSKPSLDEDMLDEMRKGPYGSMHRAERIKRVIRFSVQANHGPQ